MRPASWLLAVLVLAACHIERAASGRPPGTRTAVDSLSLVEGDSAARAAVRRTLQAYYQRFSRRDWPAFRRSFWDGATITTRWTPPGARAERVVVQPVDEFVRRAPEGPGRLAVFSEAPLEVDVHLYGDLAQAWVLYRARFGVTADSVTEHHGIDAFHLMRDDGQWRIVSLTFVNETPERPLVRR
jgi:hypothetical protein